MASTMFTSGSFTLGYRQATLPFMKMDEIYAVRLDRFKRVMADQFEGKQAAIAEAVGKPANYVSRVLNGSKKLGEEMVREFEEALGKPPYWFDGIESAVSWPFPGVDPKQYAQLSDADRHDLMALALAKIGRLPVNKSASGEQAA